MANNAIPGFGTQFQMSISSVFTTITATVEQQPPQLSRTAIDTTDFQSSGQWKAKLRGMKDGGQATLKINYKPTDVTHQALKTAFNRDPNDDPDDFKIIFNDGSSSEWTFSGIVTAFNPETPQDDKVSASITIDVSGSVTTP